jgi:hypothetical protein
VELTKEERARITDSKHKLQSVADSLTHVDPRKILRYDEIEECLDDADKSLKGALKLPPAPDEPKSGKKTAR